MDLFDLLDRECDRLVTDFDDCLTPAGRDALWPSAGQTVLGRMATYTLVIEQVLQPALLVLQFDAFDPLCRTHERLRRVVAEALIGMRGPRPVAEKTLKAAQQILLRYRMRLRRDFYPALYRLLSTPEALLLSDDMLQWVDRHCRQIRAVPETRRGVGRRARPIDTSRIPTLHHAVARDAAHPPRHSP